MITEADIEKIIYRALGRNWDMKILFRMGLGDTSKMLSTEVWQVVKQHLGEK